jgi:hypothetical protein
MVTERGNKIVSTHARTPRRQPGATGSVPRATTMPALDSGSDGSRYKGLAASRRTANERVHPRVNHRLLEHITQPEFAKASADRSRSGTVPMKLGQFVGVLYVEPRLRNRADHHRLAGKDIEDSPA